MSKKRFIDSHFWSDTWIDTLERDEKFFFLYLLTNDKTSIAGVYEIPIKMIAFESGFTREEVVILFKKLSSRVRYINGWVVLKNAIKNQNYHNAKIERGIEIILQNCPSELLEFVDVPKDFKKIQRSVDKPNPQQGLFDDSSMSHDVSSHLDHDSDIDSNIDSNSDSEHDAKSRDSNKFEPGALTPEQKRRYALAMEKEREQKKSAEAARSRPRSKPEPLGKSMERKWR